MPRLVNTSSWKGGKCPTGVEGFNRLIEITLAHKDIAQVEMDFRDLGIQLMAF